MKLFNYKTLLISLVLIVFLVGCASTRYIQSPSTTAPERGISGSNSDLDITVNCIIHTDGPGSWVRKAPWDEYVVTVSTTPDKSLTLYRVALIDATGVHWESHDHPAQLITASDELSKVYASMGRTGAALAGTAASLVTAIPFIGPAISIGGAVTSQFGLYASAKDQANMNEEFARRRMPSPRSLPSNVHVTGSIFFPIIPNPKAIMFEYRAGQDMNTLEIPLETIRNQPQ